MPDAGQQCDVEESAYLSQAMEVREHLKNHDEQFSVEIAFENEPENPGELVYAVYNKSVEHTGNPDEGDYLKLGIYQLGMSFEIVSGVQGIKQIISYEVEYNSSKSQDDEAKEKADKIIEYLDLDGKSDYEKILNIYSYVAYNVVYDYDRKDDETTQIEHSMYAALCENKAVCQGYALSIYR
ncbi:MAG: hypothetical protein PUA84_06115, partial [Oscillospiraceae bacterium]|nr:hypothetical protein [Oscillospiraceae bacterium]